MIQGASPSSSFKPEALKSMPLRNVLLWGSAIVVGLLAIAGLIFWMGGSSNEGVSAQTLQQSQQPLSPAARSGEELLTGQQMIPVVALPTQSGPAVRIFPPGVDPMSGESQPLVRTNGTVREVSLQTSSVQILSPPLESSSLNASSVNSTDGEAAVQLVPDARSALSIDKKQPESSQMAANLVDTPTPVPQPTATPLATATPIPPPTNSGPPPTPYIEVLDASGSGILVDLRTGPGPEYPAVAKLGPGIPIAIDGRNPEGNWFRICCINGGSFWVAAGGPLMVGNPVREVALFVPDLPPTPTPTPTFTATPPPFDRAVGPEFFPTNNGFLTIWAKVFVGGPESEDPLAGYMLAVEFEDGESGAVERRLNASGMESSADSYLVSAAEGAGNRVFFNYKYEYHPGQPPEEQTMADMLGTGTWRIWLTNAEGTRLSEPVTFTTDPGNPNREIYVGWARVR